MARIIHIARCPRCNLDVRKDTMLLVTPEWTGSDDAGDGLWSDGQPDGTAAVLVCDDCWETLQQLHCEALYWAGEARLYLEGG